MAALDAIQIANMARVWSYASLSTSMPVLAFLILIFQARVVIGGIKSWHGTFSTNYDAFEYEDGGRHIPGWMIYDIETG